MTSDQPDRQTAGFRGHASLTGARDTLRQHVDPVERVENLPLTAADGRVLAVPVTAQRDVPHYRRAAMDGYAIRAADVAGASTRSPAVLSVAENPARLDRESSSTGDDAGSDSGDLRSGTAARVHTGSAVPEGADAVVPIEHVERIDDEIELVEPVAPGDDVAPIGEDVTAGQALYEPGDRLRPSDLGLLKVAGIDEVTVRERPTVGIVPTGEELVQRDPEPGQAVETNGLTVSRLVERWGGKPTYRSIVGDERAALRAAIQRDVHRDVVVTTGGSSVGERDLLPEVVDDLGEVLVHGVGIQPGHPVALGVVEETPVLCLPGYPVSCIVTAVQFLRPALRWASGTAVESPPSTEATLGRKIDSEPGTRTFARVTLDAGDEDDVDGGGDANAGNSGTSNDETDVLRATPTRARGAGVLSSVGLADGWVVVPENSEGLPAGERVTVEDWERLP